nr:CoA pyrophosphatase [Desulfobulbaceae bacterium]
MISVDTPLIDSAVLVPIYRDSGGKLRLVLIRRSSGGIHGGQLAFPGGKHEPDDQIMLLTALRETREEIGLHAERVAVLAELPPVETKATGFRIYPFLGVIVPQKWVVDEREVADVLDIDLEALADPSMYGEEMVRYDAWPCPRRIAFYRVGTLKLWGASFRILQQLMPRILAQEWQV